MPDMPSGRRGKHAVDVTEIKGLLPPAVTGGSVTIHGGRLHAFRPLRRQPARPWPESTGGRP